MKNTIETKIWQREFHLHVEEIFPILQGLKQADKQSDFQAAMEKILPGIKRYIDQRLRSSIKKGTIPAGKYKVDDFVDELYIVAYDHIMEVTADKNLYRWLFKKAVALMEDTIVEEDYDKFYYKNLDDYTKVEREEMEEKFSTDGDGDFVMEEELDDSSYNKNDYTLENGFIENIEDDLIAKLNTEQNKNIIQHHIQTVVSRLPFPIQAIYELQAIQKFKPEEIAYIKDIPVEKIEEYLAAAKTCIRVSLETKYLK